MQQISSPSVLQSMCVVTKRKQTFFSFFPFLFSPRSSTNIFCTVSLLMSNSSTIIQSNRLQFWSNSCCTFFVFCHPPEGRPLLGLPWTSSWPSRNCPYKQKYVGLHYCFISIGCMHHLNSFCCSLTSSKTKLYCYSLFTTWLHDNILTVQHYTRVYQNCLFHAEITWHETSSVIIVITSSSGH